MKLASKILVFACWSAFFSACTENSSTASGVEDQTLSVDSTGNSSGQSIAAPIESERPMCKLVGSVLEGNLFWAANEGRLVVVSAEAETTDEALGESHRILSVYDNNCKQVFREVLPVNLSADYPYYLSDITYNKVSKQVAIRGFDKFYVLDLGNLKLSQPLVPKFLNQRYLEDAQSGAIKRLEIWENYLLGFAASMGPFAFDLSDQGAPKAVLPLAEYTLVKGEQFNSLFLLKSTDANNGYQAFMPDFDYDKEVLSLNVLFEKPLNFDPNINKSFRNNRFILLKELVGGTIAKPYAIDMKARALVDLPAEIAAKKDTEVLDWLKKQAK